MFFLLTIIFTILVDWKNHLISCVPVKNASVQHADVGIPVCGIKKASILGSMRGDEGNPGLLC